MQHEWNLKSTVCVNANGIWLVFFSIDFSISLNDAIFFVSLSVSSACRFPNVRFDAYG